MSKAPEIENIEILEQLGAGGMSLVYKARQKQLDRIVAVKVLSKSVVIGEDGIKRFQNEAKVTSSLDHPNIVKIVSFGISRDGQPYLVMEYLEGLSLAAELEKHGRLKLQKFKDVFLPVLSALELAHDSGVIHRDIKPGNIMVCRSETGGEIIKLLDFGIAKYSSEVENQQGLTKTEALLGSPSYMSPEQCQGKPLSRLSDLYSLACVMFESLTGELPFSGESALHVMQKHSTQAAPKVSELSRKIDISKELAQVVLWGLAKDPALRPQSASAYAGKLNEVLTRSPLDKLPKLKTSKGLQQSIYAIATLLLLTSILITWNVLSKTTSMPAKSIRIQTSRTQGVQENPVVSDLASAERRLASTERVHGLNSAEILPKLDEVATILCSQKQYTKAATNYRRSFAIRKKVYGIDRPGFIADIYGLAFCCQSSGKQAEAEQLFKRALAIREETPGTSSIDLSDSLCKLAEYYKSQENYSKAEPLYKRSLLLDEGIVEKPKYRPMSVQNHTTINKTLSESMHIIDGRNKSNLQVEQAFHIIGLADCYQTQHKYEEAEPLWKRSLSLMEKSLAPEHEYLIHAENGLAFCYEKEGKHDAAKPLLKHIRALQALSSQSVSQKK